jgi:hypothetical protein
MADSIRRIDYFYAQIQDKPGEGARILGALKEAGVNLLSCTAFPIEGGRAQLDFVPEKSAALAGAARSAGLSLSPAKQAFFIQGGDRVGVVSEILKKLGDAGVNVHALNAACAPGGGYGMILWVKPKEIDAAAKALGI